MRATRHDSHLPAAVSEICGPDLHPCLHQDLPRDPGRVPGPRLHAVKYRNGAGDGTHQVGARISSSALVKQQVWCFKTLPKLEALLYH